MELNEKDILAYIEEEQKDVDVDICIASPTKNNIVGEDSVKKVQLRTLREISDALAKTFGPMGSNTMFITGHDAATCKVEYSKDGHKVLQSIISTDPIAMATQKQLVNVTGHTENIVGDGTTSATLLSYQIFKKLMKIMENRPGVPPYTIIRTFKEVVKEVQEEILKHGKAITLDDIGKICLISTNGDREIADEITGIYKDFGFDVSIEVGISTGQDTLLKVYDGCTINTGYADTAFINRVDNGTCEIRNPRIYQFQDSIDTPDMVSLFEKIIHHNIMEPISNEENPIPTVIFAPRLSRDLSAMFEQLVNYLYQYHTKGMDSQKPPLLVVTNLCGADVHIMDDIGRLCECKPIRRYIDPKNQEADIERGLAPTLENVHEFCGSAELIVSDKEKTKFINPVAMYDDVDEDGNPIQSATFRMVLDFLEAELKAARENNETAGTIASYKKRIRALKANMVEYLIGGISLEDRDSKRDLVVDAVKNCASASLHGVGYAANFEGLWASFILHKKYEGEDLLKDDIINAIFDSYVDVTVQLYNTVAESDTEVATMVIDSLKKTEPINLYTKEYDGSVLTSIMTDVEILNAISKLITIMATSNQCILQAPALNIYM